MSSTTTDSVSKNSGTSVMKSKTARIAAPRPLSPSCPFRPRRRYLENATETTSTKIATDQRIAEAVANCGSNLPANSGQMVQIIISEPNANVARRRSQKFPIIRTSRIASKIHEPIPKMSVWGKPKRSNVVGVRAAFVSSLLIPVSAPNIASSANPITNPAAKR